MENCEIKDLQDQSDLLSNEIKHNLTTDSNKTQWGMTGMVMRRGMN